MIIDKVTQVIDHSPSLRYVRELNLTTKMPRDFFVAFIMKSIATKDRLTQVLFCRESLRKFAAAHDQDEEAYV